MVDVAKNEGVKDESEEKKEEVLDSLDAVHERTVQELENEGENDDSAEDDTNTADKDSGADSDAADDDSKGEDAEDDTKDGGETGDDDTKDASKDDDEVDEPEKQSKPEPAPELDTDTTKNVEGKIAVKDYEGSTHYFNNLDEVPEDFEPATYKEWGKAVQKFTDKEQTDRVTEQERQEKASEAESARRIASIKDAWSADEKKLVDSKALPSDAKDRKPIVDDVFVIMNEKLSDGKVIDFETGFELYQARQNKNAGGEKKKKVVEDKKRRGGMVSGAGTGVNAEPKSRVIEGPPAGVTLDDVHAQVLGSL